MALTESKIKDLEDKNFDKLLEKHREEWQAMVHDPAKFTKTHITAGREPRPDDVLKELLPMLEVNTNLREHQEDNKARFKHYREYFGEYIIDRFLVKPEKKK